MEIIEQKDARLSLPKCKLTENGMGLIVDQNITKDDLVDIGKTLKVIEGANQFWIGDWINANWGEYERGKYEEAEKLGYESTTTRKYSEIADNIKSGTRVPLLTWTHHREIAYGFKPEVQQEWLQKAVDNNWTVRELKNAIREASKPKTPDAPEGEFRILYGDPPWKYSDELIKEYGAVEHHYTTMSIDELCALNKPETMEEKKKLPETTNNAILFLWVTSPILDESFKVIKSWGFEYKTSFIWDKVKHNYGHYNSVRHELLLICTKGSCVPDTHKLFDSVQTIERTEKHSEKPEEFREIIDTLYPTGNRIELFSRKTAEEINKIAKVKNWKTWMVD